VSTPSSTATSAPRLFAFDTSEPSLGLLPLCARRALDVTGIKLSLAAYQSLSEQDRYALARSGSQESVDADEVRRIVAQAHGEIGTLPASADPDPLAVPSALSQALGRERPVPEKVWQNLSSLERYALVKVCARGKPERISACYDEVIGARQLSSHLKPAGGVTMVSVAGKAETARSARAESFVTMSGEAYERLVRAHVPKGDVLGTARLAGIMASKKTADLIPLCHPLPLQHAEVNFQFFPQKNQLHIECKVEVFGRTGVEMEALLGASTAALTVYDMLKSIDRGLVIGPTRLLEKSGGRSGHYLAPADDATGEP